MALKPNDLIYPGGDLLPSLFPDGDIQTVVGVWLTEATGKTSDTDAQRAWVYYRAYSAVATRIAGTPSSESSFNNQVTNWGADRVKHFAELAETQLAEYRRLTGSDAMTANKPAGFTVY